DIVDTAYEVHKAVEAVVTVYDLVGCVRVVWFDCVGAESAEWLRSGVVTSVMREKMSVGAWRV
ncbi:hypothetical protein V7S43_003718, partial [Phytophthora oleae]